MNLKFSIIIPVRGINDFLKENIFHLRKLNYSPFEVIILTDADVSYDFQDTRFKCFATGPVGPGEKRNIGAKHASGDVLAFLDDDAFPRPDWLEQANIQFLSHEIYALGAPAVTPLDADPMELGSGLVLESLMASGGTPYRHYPSKPRMVDDYPTVNLFVRKWAFEKVGGFDKEFWPGEDTKLCLDLVKSFGSKFLYDPRPIVFHHRRHLFMPHLKQVSRYGMHRGQFARIFPETSRVPMYFAPSLFVLGLFLGPILSVFFPPLWTVYFSVLYVYFVWLLCEGIISVLKTKKILYFFLVAYGIFLTHLVYGVSFLVGFFKRPQLKLREISKDTNNYVGG